MHCEKLSAINSHIGTIYIGVNVNLIIYVKLRVRGEKSRRNIYNFLKIYIKNPDISLKVVALI